MRMMTQETQVEPKIRNVQEPVSNVKARSVKILKKTKESLKAYEIAKATPDIDEARVVHLKSAIQSGTYQIDAEKIAEKILKEHNSVFCMKC